MNAYLPNTDHTEAKIIFFYFEVNDLSVLVGKGDRFTLLDKYQWKKVFDV